MMSIESVRLWLAEYAPDLAIIGNGMSTATVAEAAVALGVEPARIAKTLAVRTGETLMLVVARGDARLDSVKFRNQFGGRPRMLGADEAEIITGHPVGGVCPFGLALKLPVYCDLSIREFATVFPAAGSRELSVEIAPDRLCAITGGEWTDVCRVAV